MEYPRQNHITNTEYKPADWLEAAIIVELYETNSTLSTSELRERLGVSSTEPIRYRLREHLEERGIVEITKSDSADGHLPPVVAELTEAGYEWAESIDLDAHQEADTVTDRLDRIEALLTQFDSRLHRLELAAGLHDSEQNLPTILDLRAGYVGLSRLIDGDANQAVPEAQRKAHKQVQDEILDQ